MTLKTIYIARHGYRSNWLPAPFPQPPTGIDSDFPLAKHGEDQAQELAHYILSISPEPEIIFSSPFYRCLQTSSPIAKVLDIDILLEHGIGEWYKPDRPVIPKPASFERLSQDFKSLKNDWEPTLIPSSKGETEDDIFKRCQDFLKLFIPKFESNYPKVETILFVTHAATKISLGLSLLGLKSVHDTLDDEDTRLRAGACSLDRYERILDEDGNKWVITMNGNCEFLTDGEEMHWDFQNGFEAGSNEDLKARKLKELQKQKQKQKQKQVDVDVELDEEEYQDVYVTLDIPKRKYQPSSIPPTAKLQISGLHTEKPLFKIDKEVYQGDWSKLVGTEVTFNEDLSETHKVTDRIQLEDVVPS